MGRGTAVTAPRRPLWRTRKTQPDRSEPWQVLRQTPDRLPWVVSSHASFVQAVAAMVALDKGSR